MPLDPYEMLDSIFTNIADAIRYRDGKPTYQYFKDKIMTDYSVDIGSYGEAAFNYLMSNPTYTFTLQLSGNYFNIVSSASGYEAQGNKIWGPFHWNQLYLTNNVATGANAVDRNQTWYCDTGDAVYYGITDYLPPLPPEPVEEVTTVSSELQTILENKTGARATSTGGLLTRLKEKTHKCLMTVVEDISTYALHLVLIESVDDSVDISETDVSIVQTEDIPSNVTITVNVQKSVCVRVYGVNNQDQWNNESETATTIGYQETKTFSSTYISLVGSGDSFSNTKMVQPPTDISPLDFAKRISSTITERSKSSLNAIFTDVANAIRHEQGLPTIDPHVPPEPSEPVLAPNGKTYKRRYSYRRFKQGWNNFETVCYTNYKLALVKNGFCYYVDPGSQSQTLPYVTVYVGDSETYIEDMCSLGDYYVTNKVSGYNGNQPLCGPDMQGVGNWQITTDIPIFDSYNAVVSYLTGISVPDMPTLIRNL